ncbi:MAG TPA: amino acid adenylation domain-containing protein, partial [Burkholderiaceae bacterium]|nr:amino acid adenylation domain-containing protein [Burkholderiaceae bacterium]
MNLRDQATPEFADILFGPKQAELLRDEVLADLLEATAARIPDQTALIFGERSVSYRELDQQATLVASRLTTAGVGPGKIVGLWLPRGIDLLIMQAGIAKAGAAWLPVADDTPVERLTVCLQDAQAVGIVSCDAFLARLDGAGFPVWTAETLLDTNASVALLPLRGGSMPTDPAYVIYTSGSTGKPKGIVINQNSICHFLRSENAVLGVRQSDRVYQGFSLAFDMSFEEIWISYLVGATLWIAPRELTADPEALPRALAQNQVTVLHAVPTLLALFVEDVPTLRLINLGGEACPESLVDRWSQPDRQIFNTYGPTEATVSASLAELHPGEAVTIGRPLPNYGLLVIDPAIENGLTLLPRGEVGELCITGPGLAAGYLGRPDLTAEKFLANPWTSGADDQRLYRTGDLARIADDGKVQCLGRADDQVKIRGFRVELGEIEAVLAQQPGIGTVAVILRPVDGFDQLISFIVPESGAEPSPSVLRAALAERLPPYMVPGRFEILDSMPRLTSGKIDRKNLKTMPLSAAPEQSGESDIAETPAEEALFAALGTLFPGQPIRRNDDFFSDLGGHSFFAARLASTLRADPRFAHITVRDIYQRRVIARIAEGLAETQEKTLTSDINWTPPLAWRRWTCGVAQAAAIPGLVTMRMAQWLAPFFTYHFLTGDPTDSIPVAVAASVAVFLLAT